MANMGNAVTAMLKLDATDFTNNINRAVSAIDKLQTKANSNKSFSKLANSLATFRRELNKLESTSSVSSEALTKLSSNITRVGNALTVVKKFETEVQIFSKMANSVGQFTRALMNLNNTQRQTSSISNQTTNSIRTMGTSLNTVLKIRL